MVLITSIAFDLSFPKLCEIQRSDAKWQLGQPNNYVIMMNLAKT